MLAEAGGPVTRAGRRRNRMLIDIDLLNFALPLHGQRGAH